MKAQNPEGNWQGLPTTYAMDDRKDDDFLE
jgi:hypothetical protein